MINNNAFLLDIVELIMSNFVIESYYQQLASALSERFNISVEEIQSVIDTTSIEKKKKEKKEESEEKEECSVCCDVYTASVRKPVGCLYCGYKCCIDCVRNFLLSKRDDAKCMSCKKEWNKEFLDLNLTKAFVNGPYKKHREDVLVEREMSFLPAAQIALEERKELGDKIEKLEVLIEIANAKYKHAKATLTLMKQQLGMHGFQQMCTDEGCTGKMRTLAGLKVSRCTECQKRLCKECYCMYNGAECSHPVNKIQPLIEKQTEMNQYKQTKEELYIERENVRYGNGGPKERKTFVRKCPVDDCRGFLSTQWKCGMCERRICNQCYETKDGDEHTCNPENVEMVKLLAKDSKPCPSCGQFSQKLSGCSQMWCLMCHVAWDWNTGQIDKGRVHNPHYYEWQRRGGGARREQGDEVCGGLPPTYQLPRLTNNLEYCHRFVAHARIALMPHYRVPVMTPEINQDLCMAYLEKSITKDDWKRALVQREKKRLLQQEIYDVLDMFVNVAEESFRKIKNGSSMVIEEIELAKLREYINEQLSAISKRYNNTTLIITHFNRNEQPEINTNVWAEFPYNYYTENRKKKENEKQKEKSESNKQE